jgi:hypothetical protein
MAALAEHGIKPGFLAPRFGVEEHGEQCGRREAERGSARRPAKSNQGRTRLSRSVLTGREAHRST